MTHEQVLRFFQLYPDHLNLRRTDTPSLTEFERIFVTRGEIGPSVCWNRIPRLIELMLERNPKSNAEAGALYQIEKFMEAVG